MGIVSMIEETAIDMLCRRGANAGDGFRQWLYVRPWGPDPDYSISDGAREAVYALILRGKSATQIVRILCRAHG